MCMPRPMHNDCASGRAHYFHLRQFWKDGRRVLVSGDDKWFISCAREVSELNQFNQWKITTPLAHAQNQRRQRISEWKYFFIEILKLQPCLARTAIFEQCSKSIGRSPKMKYLGLEPGYMRLYSFVYAHLFTFRNLGLVSNVLRATATSVTVVFATNRFLRIVIYVNQFLGCRASSNLTNTLSHFYSPKFTVTCNHMAGMHTCYLEFSGGFYWVQMEQQLNWCSISSHFASGAWFICVDNSWRS